MSLNYLYKNILPVIMLGACGCATKFIPAILCVTWPIPPPPDGSIPPGPTSNTSMILYKYGV